MKVLGITSYNYRGLNNKPHSQTKPAFKGTEYEYYAECGSVHSGRSANCQIYDRNNNVIRSGSESMYASAERAVDNALRYFYPTGMEVYTNRNIYRKPDERGILYVADPEEGITDEMREKYDFIATENKPSIPSLDDLNHKFHTITGDKTNYNEQFKIAIDYYNRLLKADLKTRNRIELKNIEDEENLQLSLKNRDKYYFDYLEHQDNPEITDKLNTESYYVYQNEQNMRDNSEKYDYYSGRIEDSKAKIRFLTKAEEILDRAGGMLIQRDILASRYIGNKECAEDSIIKHIDRDNAIKMKKAERKYLQEQLDLNAEQRRKLEKQKFDGNHSGYEVWRRTANCGGLELRTQKEKCLERIKELNKEIAKLKQEQVHTGKYLQRLRPVLAEDRRKIQEEIDKAEGIYQELKAHYENNNPF